MAARATSIIVDWGTTSLRAALVGNDGAELEHLETADGISSLAEGQHEPALMSALAPWFSKNGALPVAALGMITSRNGWVEVAYVPCPAGPAELAAGTVRRTLPNGSDLVFLPGLNDPGRQPFPDVMRGEETQIVGHGLTEDATLIIPGTHSKWARVKAGRIDGFQTFVTGEIFNLLINHSFIARGSAQPPVDDPEAYLWGLKEAKNPQPCCRCCFPHAQAGSPANCRHSSCGLMSVGWSSDRNFGRPAMRDGTQRETMRRLWAMMGSTISI